MDGIDMKKIALLLSISILLLACNLPFTISMNSTDTPAAETEAVIPSVLPSEAPVEEITEAPTELLTDEPLNGTELNLGGVYMVLPPCLANNAIGTLIAAVPYDEMNGPMEYYPENRKITFQGYPLSNKFFSVDDPDQTGGLVVYPVADYIAMNQFVANHVAEMQTLLATRPNTPDAIPLLPIFNAAQTFRAQVKYMDFQNGQGVRFLTEYAQYYAPVNNQDLFYAYQGITTDGKYWVSAIMPVNAAYLQENSQSVNVPAGGILPPTFDDPNYEVNMAAYSANMINKLNTTPDTDFTPALDCLDQYFSSLSISD